MGLSWLPEAPLRIMAQPGEIKLLAGPYGWNANSGIWIRLEALDDDLDRTQVAEVLRRYDCYEPAIPKILNCLNYSGQYSCILQYAWMSQPRGRQCLIDLRKAGVRLIVTKVVDCDFGECPEHHIFRLNSLTEHFDRIDSMVTVKR